LAVAEFSLTPSAFGDGGSIPRRHTCDGEDRSPSLSWSAPPTGIRSLALILDDPDAPGGRCIHWLAWGITPDTGGLGEGEAAPLEGRNDFGSIQTDPDRSRRIVWMINRMIKQLPCGRCPPAPGDPFGPTAMSTSRCHHAVAEKLRLPSGAGVRKLEQALGAKGLAVAKLVGTYQR
jgi:phosphatidylethanolamine-binding protein (PEBP) family uncharacterized protein